MNLHCSLCERPRFDGRWGRFPEAILANSILGQGVQGFVCETCIAHAARILNHVKGVDRNVHVTDHAVVRFQERRKERNISQATVRSAIADMLRRARQIVFTNKITAQRIQNNHGRYADYYLSDDCIFVICRDGPATVVTVELTWDRQLGVSYWYLIENLCSLAKLAA